MGRSGRPEAQIYSGLQRQRSHQVGLPDRSPGPQRLGPEQAATGDAGPDLDAFRHRWRRPAKLRRVHPGHVPLREGHGRGEDSSHPATGLGAAQLAENQVAAGLSFRSWGSVTSGIAASLTARLRVVAEWSRSCRCWSVSRFATK